MTLLETYQSVLKPSRSQGRGRGTDIFCYSALLTLLTVNSQTNVTSMKEAGLALTPAPETVGT
jgi:hypothetical protein